VKPAVWRREIALPRPERAAALAALGLLALALFAAREAVFLGRVFYQRDLHLQWYGQIETFVAALHSGAWPLWDPRVDFGRPLLANANNQVFYPPTWLNLVLRPERYFTLFFVAHVWLAGLGVFALARRYGVSTPAAFVGAAVFIAGGPLLSLGNLWNHLAAAAFMPWSLWAADRFARRPRGGPLLLWGALLAAPILAGSPDVFMMTAALGAADVGRRALARRFDAGTDATPRRLATGFALALLFALALAAAQLAPSLDLALRSGRAQASAAARSYWSLPPAALAQALVPLLPDDPTLGAAAREALFGGREPLLLSLYLGAGALALALAAFLPLPPGAAPRRGVRSFLALAIGASLLFALGPQGPLYTPLVALVPPLRLLRFPSKAVLVAALGLALLCALGAEAWRRTCASRRRRLVHLALPLALVAAAALAGRGAAWPEAAPALTRVACVTLGLAGCALVAALRPRAATAALALTAAVAVLDPLWTHRDLNPTAPAAFYALRPEFLPLLRDPDGRRTYVVDYAAEPGLSRRLLGREIPYLVGGRGGSTPRFAAALGMRAYPVPPVLAGWGVPEGYSRDLLGLQPPALAHLYALLLRSEGTPLHARLLRLGSVGRVVSLHPEGLEELRPLARVPGPFFEPVRVAAVPGALPRAYVVGSARRLGDAEAVRALLAPEFDPTREVLLGDTAGRPAPAGAADVGTDAGAARVVEERADRVRIEARLAHAGWLVLTDAYDAGWRVTVGGREARVERANLAFRAVTLPAGEHRLEFVYRPRAVTAGLALSALALLGACAALVRSATAGAT
jgi:hypothetical protein